MVAALGDVLTTLRPWLLWTGGLVWFLLAVLAVRKLVAALRSRAREDIAGRWVLVTGCDSGFGQGVIGALVARGAQVIACCLTEEGAAAAVAAGACTAPQLDLTDDDALTAMAHEAHERSGG